MAGVAPQGARGRCEPDPEAGRAGEELNLRYGLVILVSLLSALLCADVSTLSGDRQQELTRGWSGSLRSVESLRIRSEVSCAEWCLDC